MADLKAVQADTGPDIKTQLTFEENGVGQGPVPLTDATVYFQMRKKDDRRYTVNAAAIIDDEGDGRVRYSWGPNDLDNAGVYQTQWEVHFPDGQVITSVDTVDLEVRRQ